MTAYISRIPNTDKPRLLIRQDLIDILDGDKAAGMVLAFFVSCDDLVDKCDQEIEGYAIERDTYIQYHTIDKIKEGILYLFSNTTIKACIQKLKNKGYILINKNPINRMDNTNYYEIVPEKIRKDILRLNYKKIKPTRE